MRKVTLITILGVLLFSLTGIAQEKSSLNEQLKSYLHQDFFKINILLQSEGWFSFKDDDFQGAELLTLSMPGLACAAILTADSFTEFTLMLRLSRGCLMLMQVIN